MVLFLKEDYPVAHALLEKVNVSSRSATGGRTIPNLVQLFDMILQKNKETFEFLVSYNLRVICLTRVFKVLPMTLQVLQEFYPHSVAKVVLNQFLNAEFHCKEVKSDFQRAPGRSSWSYETHNVRLYT